MSEAQISLSALAENYRYACRLAQDKSLMCVVKADAYGHGLVPCATHLFSLGCHLFAVANLDEAMTLRRALPDCEVLILGYTPPDCAALLTEHRIAQTVFSGEYAHALSRAALAPIAVHWKLDTGMHRLGFSCDEAGLCALVAASRLPHLQSDGLYTHAADAAHRIGVKTARQHADFLRAFSFLRAQGLSVRHVHTQNSAALSCHSFCEGSVARTGLLLYGYGDTGVRPILRWRSRLVQVKRVAHGESVGYFPPYRPHRDCKIGVVPVGYADGYSRAYCGAPIEVGGVRARAVSVCMDMTLAELAPDCRASEGTAVTLLGEGCDAEVLARHAATIPYEVLCRIGARVGRQYIS